MKRKGSAIIISLILTSVILGITITVASITVKYLRNVNIIEESSVAFVAADSAYECVLRADQVKDAFYVSASPSTISTIGINCGGFISETIDGKDVRLISSRNLDANAYVFSFFVNYPNGSCAEINVKKQLTFVQNEQTNINVFKGLKTTISSVGRNTCKENSVVRKVISSNE